MERKSISVKLENCALSCYVTCNVTLYKRSKNAPPQIFFKRMQSYFRAVYPNQLLEYMSQELISQKNTQYREIFCYQYQYQCFAHNTL